MIWRFDWSTRELVCALDGSRFSMRVVAAAGFHAFGCDSPLDIEGALRAALPRADRSPIALR